MAFLPQVRRAQQCPLLQLQLGSNMGTRLSWLGIAQDSLQVVAGSGMLVRALLAAASSVSIQRSNRISPELAAEIGHLLPSLGHRSPPGVPIRLAELVAASPETLRSVARQLNELLTPPAKPTFAIEAAWQQIDFFLRAIGLPDLAANVTGDAGAPLEGTENAQAWGVDDVVRIATRLSEINLQDAAFLFADSSRYHVEPAGPLDDEMRQGWTTEDTTFVTHGLKGLGSYFNRLVEERLAVIREAI